MRSMKAIGAALAAAVSMSALAAAQDLTITQVDSSRLLAEQRVRLYLYPPGGSWTGEGAIKEFQVFEAGEGGSLARREILGTSSSVNAEEGISFFLLIDDSGSMWYGPGGEDVADEASMRIGQAKAAARSFLGKLSARDSVGLASFNTRYALLRPVIADRAAIERSLDSIGRPSGGEEYTELYASIPLAVAELAKSPGRKVLIVLSDGENYPYSVHKGEPSPEFGTELFGTGAGVDAANEAGVSCFVVRFGASKDPEVDKVAAGSGGRVFDASDGAELAGVYAEIQKRVLAEMSVDYRAGMDKGGKRLVRVVAIPASGGLPAAAERSYYAGTVLGWSASPPEPWQFLFFAVPLALWAAFVFLKLEKPVDAAGIRLLGGKGLKTMDFALEAKATVIGGSDAADITIAGNPALKGSHATIVFDADRKTYAIKADGELRVNNKPVKTKILEPGDMIDMAGTVVVFDEPMKPPKKKG